MPFEPPIVFERPPKRKRKMKKKGKGALQISWTKRRNRVLSSSNALCDVFNLVTSNKFEMNWGSRTGAGAQGTTMKPSDHDITKRTTNMRGYGYDGYFYKGDLKDGTGIWTQIIPITPEDIKRGRGTRYIRIGSPENEGVSEEVIWSFFPRQKLMIVKGGFHPHSIDADGHKLWLPQQYAVTDFLSLLTTESYRLEAKEGHKNIFYFDLQKVEWTSFILNDMQIFFDEGIEKFVEALFKEVEYNALQHTYRKLGRKI